MINDNPHEIVEEVLYDMKESYCLLLFTANLINRLNFLRSYRMKRPYFNRYWSLFPADLTRLSQSTGYKTDTKELIMLLADMSERLILTQRITGSNFLKIISCTKLSSLLNNMLSNRIFCRINEADGVILTTGCHQEMFLHHISSTFISVQRKQESMEAVLRGLSEYVRTWRLKPYPRKTVTRSSTQN